MDTRITVSAFYDNNAIEPENDAEKRKHHSLAYIGRSVDDGLIISQLSGIRLSPAGRHLGLFSRRDARPFFQKFGMTHEMRKERVIRQKVI
jgi:hypothetical protein